MVGFSARALPGKALSKSGLTNVDPLNVAGIPHAMARLSHAELCNHFKKLVVLVHQDYRKNLSRDQTADLPADVQQIRNIRDFLSFQYDAKDEAASPERIVNEFYEAAKGGSRNLWNPCGFESVHGTAALSSRLLTPDDPRMCQPIPGSKLPLPKRSAARQSASAGAKSRETSSSKPARVSRAQKPKIGSSAQAHFK